MKISRVILGTFSWEASRMEIKVCSFRFCKYGVWEKSVAGEWPSLRFWSWRSILEFCSLDRRFSMFLRFVASHRDCAWRERKKDRERERREKKLKHRRRRWMQFLTVPRYDIFNVSFSWVNDHPFGHCITSKFKEEIAFKLMVTPSMSVSVIVVSYL